MRFSAYGWEGSDAVFGSKLANAVALGVAQTKPAHEHRAVLLDEQRYTCSAGRAFGDAEPAALFGNDRAERPVGLLDEAHIALFPCALSACLSASL